MPNQDDPQQKRVSCPRMARSTANCQEAGGTFASGEPDFPISGFFDIAGKILKSCKLVLIFWGAEWAAQSASPSMKTVVQAIQGFLDCAYMFKLLQYRGIVGASLLAQDLVVESEPPNPFSDTDVSGLIISRILSKAVPPPGFESPEILYCVIMPQGIGSVLTTPEVTVYGEHFAFPPTTVSPLFPLYGAWVTNDGTLTTCASIPHVLSHELVEVCTDPEGTGIVLTADSQAQEQEICDVCESWSPLLNGVAVQAYWSQADGACVAPRQRSLAWCLNVFGLAFRPIGLRTIMNLAGTNSLKQLLTTGPPPVFT